MSSKRLQELLEGVRRAVEVLTGPSTQTLLLLKGSKQYAARMAQQLTLEADQEGKCIACVFGGIVFLVARASLLHPPGWQMKQRPSGLQRSGCLWRMRRSCSGWQCWPGGGKSQSRWGCLLLWEGVPCTWGAGSWHSCWLRDR